MTTQSFKLTSLSPMVQYWPSNAWDQNPGTIVGSDVTTGQTYAESRQAVTNPSFTLDFFGTAIKVSGQTSCSMSSMVTSIESGQSTASNNIGSTPQQATSNLATFTNLPLNNHRLTVNGTCQGGNTVRVYYAQIDAWVGPSGGQIGDVIVDDFDPAMQYSSDWSPNTHLDARYYNDTQHYTSTSGGTATLQFQGTSVNVLGSVQSTHARYTVTLNGQSWTYNGYAAFNAVPVTIFYANGLDAAQTHTVSITLVDAGTDANPLYVDLDYIEYTTSTVPAGTASSPFGNPPPNIGAIVGGVVGGVAFLLLLLALFLWWRRRRRVQMAGGGGGGRSSERVGEPAMDHLLPTPFTMPQTPGTPPSQLGSSWGVPSSYGAPSSSNGDAPYSPNTATPIYSHYTSGQGTAIQYPGSAEYYSPGRPMSTSDGASVTTAGWAGVGAGRRMLVQHEDGGPIPRPLSSTGSSVSGPPSGARVGPAPTALRIVGESSAEDEDEPGAMPPGYMGSPTSGAPSSPRNEKSASATMPMGRVVGGSSRNEKSVTVMR